MQQLKLVEAGVDNSRQQFTPTRLYSNKRFYDQNPRGEAGRGQAPICEWRAEQRNESGKKKKSSSCV